MICGSGEPVAMQRSVPVVPMGIVNFSGSTLTVGTASAQRIVFRENFIQSEHYVIRKLY